MSKEKCGIEWEDCKLSLFEDLMRELAEKRKAINFFSEETSTRA